jgi:excisionase family DNA binding protein
VTLESQPGAGGARSSTGATLRCPACGERRPPAALLTLEEVALRLGTSQRHVRRLADERRIPIVNLGRYVRFDGHELEHWIDDHRIGVMDPAALARAARRRGMELGRSTKVENRHRPQQRTA